MKRVLPAVITAALAAAVIGTMFFGLWPEFTKGVDNWEVLISATMCCVGLVNLTAVHFKRIQRKTSTWYLSIMLLVVMYGMTILGVITGPMGKAYSRLFSAIQVPLASSLMAILAFYVTSASYRAFRVRSRDAAILLVSGLIVMLGRAPVGEMIFPGVGKISSWILSVPNAASMRAIEFGVYAGALITASRIILGLDRPYLGIGE